MVSRADILDDRFARYQSTRSDEDLAAWLDAYRPVVRSVALAVSNGRELDELVTAGLEAAWEASQRFDASVANGAWREYIVRRVRGAVRDHYRSIRWWRVGAHRAAERSGQEVPRVHFTGVPPSPAWSPRTEPTAEDLSPLYERLLASMTEAEHDLFLRYYFDGVPLDRLAQRYLVTTPAMSRRLTGLLDKLAECLLAIPWRGAVAP